jgi:hypothetical protein
VPAIQTEVNHRDECITPTTSSSRMIANPESKREQYERHADECLNLVKFSRDPAIRATFTAMAATWLALAEEVSPKAR